LFNDFAAISGQQTVVQDGKTVIVGEIPSYIKGDGQKVYIFRLNGTKLANIYPNGTIEVNSIVPERVKLSTDLHTHGNANLNADILIALAIKHQIRYHLKLI
jgi:hypothetical protein